MPSERKKIASGLRLKASSNDGSGSVLPWQEAALIQRCVWPRLRLVAGSRSSAGMGYES